MHLSEIAKTKIYVMKTEKEGLNEPIKFVCVRNVSMTIRRKREW